jgi:hypothetical protein
MQPTTHKIPEINSNIKMLSNANGTWFFNGVLEK